MAPKEPPLGFRGDDTLTEERLNALRPFLPDENLNFPPISERNPERLRTDLRATVRTSFSPERVRRATEATVTPTRPEGSVRSLPANRFSPEEGRPTPEATVTSTNTRGKELWDLLSDPMKLLALQGLLNEDDFRNPEDLEALYEYIDEMGWTPDTYFPERVEAIKDKFDEANVEYDESKTADENFDDLIQGNVEAEKQQIRDVLNELGVEIPESLQPSDVLADPSLVGVREPFPEQEPTSTPPAAVDPITAPPSEQPGFMPGSEPTDPVSRPPTEMPGFLGPGPITSIDPVSRPPSEQPGFMPGSDPVTTTPDSDYSFTNTGGLDPEDYQDVVEAMTSVFGIRAAFWSLDSNSLQVGVDASGNPVPPDSEDAVRVQHMLEYLVEKKITSDARVLAVVEQTPWYQSTNASMREFDAKYGGLDNFLELNRRNQLDEIGDVYAKVEDGFRRLGVQVDEERLIEIAATIDYYGYDLDDEETFRQVLEEAKRSEYQFNSETASFTEFANLRDAVAATARSYYITLPMATVAEYAEKFFTGEMTSEDLNAIFREQASARFSNDQRVQNALDAGLTLQSYFAPYQGEIEMELGRPVDLFTEFPEVIEMMGSDGVARPMTYAEMRTFARQQPEWAQSNRGQDAATDMVFELGKLFGVDA